MDEQSRAADVLIRTMQDDLQVARGTTKTAPATRLQPAVALPPGSPAKGPLKVVVPPRRKQKRGLKLWFILAGILLVAAGGLVWLFINPPRLPWDTSEEKAAAAAEVIPGDASLVMQYRLGSVEMRSAISSAWNRQQNSATVETLLRGDPRILVDDPDLSEIYYVLLPEDVRPYLVVKNTATTSRLLKDSADAHTTVLKGWLVSHSVSTDLYTQALTDTPRAASDDIFVSLPTDTPLRLYLGTGMLVQMRRDLFGISAADGRWVSAGLAGRYQSGSGAIELLGNAKQSTVQESDAISAFANQQLMGLIPGNASFVHLGTSFAADINSWPALASSASKAVLEQPAVRDLTATLAVPYAFYRAENESGVPGYGLIIELAPELQKKLAIGDQALEQGLTAFIPLLTGHDTAVSAAFADGVFLNTALRYLNLSGSNVALDYAVTDTHLLIATSKEGMFRLMETVVGGIPQSMTQTGDWPALLSAWGTMPAGTEVTLASISYEAITQLLPVNGQQLKIGLVNQAPVSDSAPVQGLLLIGRNDTTPPATVP